MVATPANKWSFDADYIQACNCDYGCPCEFSAPPTMGFCEGMGAWKIRKGMFGQVPLDGLGLSFAARWPKAIHEGNGVGGFIIDERATPAQREALIHICSGKAGGLPFEILITTFSKVLDPLFLPFQFQLNGRNSSVKIGQAISVRTEPIKNPVTGDPESVKIEHGTGFVFKEAECVSATQCEVAVGELKFSWPEKAGFTSVIHYSN